MQIKEKKQRINDAFCYVLISHKGHGTFQSKRKAWKCKLDHTVQSAYLCINYKVFKL